MLSIEAIRDLPQNDTTVGASGDGFGHANDLVLLGAGLKGCTQGEIESGGATVAEKSQPKKQPLAEGQKICDFCVNRVSEERCQGPSGVEASDVRHHKEQGEDEVQVTKVGGKQKKQGPIRKKEPQPCCTRSGYSSRRGYGSH